MVKTHKAHCHRFLQRVLLAIALTGTLASFIATTTVAFAQSDVPDAPTNVAVYIYSTQKLEVRWSSSDAADTTSFKIQWKSGSQDFDSSRQMTSDPATKKVALQSTSSVERYADTITGLTDDTEYTVRVIATNSSGDSAASPEVTGTPTDEPHLDADQAGEFIETEVVELFEGSHSWLRETWDYITSESIQVRFDIGASGGGAVHLTCRDRNFTTGQLELTEAICSPWLVQIGRYDDNLIHTVTHELGHVFTLAPVGTSTPGPLGVAHLYFHELVSAPGLGGRDCRPNELYADALSILVHGDGIVDETNYWGECELITSTVSTEALAVVRSAVAGDMPSWFDDTYDDSNGDPELGSVWADIKTMAKKSFLYYEDGVAALFQMKDSFGGYCDNAKATESVVGSGVTRNPWNDGGCVPGAPSNVSATPGSYLWYTVSWQEPLNDGGSPIQGYKVQWKSGTQEYDSSRQEVVTDLIFRDNRKFSVLLKRIWLTGYNRDHTVRVVAYNQNGDGAGTEITATTTATPSPTDTTPPRLLRAQLHHEYRGVRLIYNETLDGSSEPSRTAFTVYVNGVATGRAGLQSSVWSEANRTHILSFSFSMSGGVQPGDVVTVSYIAPGGEGAKPIQDAAGNMAAEFSHFPVHNDKTSYAITSDPGSDKTYAFNSGAGDMDVIEATVTFGEPVKADGAPELALGIGGVGTTVWKRMRYHSGSGTNSLVFRYFVEEGDFDDNGIYISALGSLKTDHGVVRYVSTGAEAPAWIRGGHHADHRVDGVRPTLVSADVLADGTGLDLRWDEDLDEGSVPTSSDPWFEVQDTSDNSVRDISSISVEGRVVTLTLLATVAETDQLNVYYEAPDSNPIRDAVGNYAGRIRDGTFETGPTAVSVTQNANSAAEFPTAEDGVRSVDENTSAGQNIGAPIGATDADSDGRTYSISGEDAAFFDVVATSGQLRTKEALDHESKDSYSFTMSVHDGKDVHGNADTTADDTVTVTITVGDVDDPPRITGPTYKEYQEGRTNAVATYTASDQDEPATQWDLTLTGADSDDLSISSGGVLTFNAVPDFENPTDANGDGRYQVTINASEQGGTRTVSLDVTIWVWNRDEAASFPTAPSTWRVGYEIALELEDLDGIFRIVEWRWERSTNQTDWTAIKGAYSSSYTPTTEDANHYLRVSVYYHDNHQWGKGFFYVSPLVQEILGVPETPAAPTVTPGVGNLSVSWTAPGAYPAITGYMVRHRESGSTDPWTENEFAADVLSYTIPNLTTGTAYTVEVQAKNGRGSSGWSSSAEGTPRAAPPPPPLPTPPTPNPVTDQCTTEDIGRLTETVTQSGTWADDCQSEVSGRGYAQYYSFSLARETGVTIELSSSADTYLYLRQGNATAGTTLHESNDIESGNTDSQVVATLAAGTYTIEATTYDADTTGSFTLTVTLAQESTESPTPAADNCLDDLGSLATAVSRNGSWTSDCSSDSRTGSYAQYYSFTLEQEAQVTIDLTSAEDTYLYLLRGSGRDGAEAASNDDIESGNTDSRVVATLAAGTYTIEATTYNASTTGSFTLTVTPAGGTDSSPGSADSCVESLGSLSEAISMTGSWTSDCSSDSRTGSYAQYYSFTLGQETQVTIDLMSAEDTYLYLLRGPGRDGAEAASNDDIESGNTDSQVVATLAAGTYTIEATTYNASTTGSFTLTVTPSQESTETPTPAADNCVDDLGSLATAVSRNGSWSSDCTSENRDGSYAQFYSFTLGQETQVTIDLTSTEDTYLYLLAGSGRDGAEAASNDDIESGNTDSQVVATLAAGTYTIEATTYDADTTGSFTLTVTPSQESAESPTPAADNCLEDLGSLAAAVSRNGSWTSDCTSENREESYAQFYSFTLGQETQVTIDLMSDEDTYLYLLRGPGRDGAEAASNDDIESGNTDSQIVATLAAGTYTIEATTYDADTTGSFTLTVTPSQESAESPTPATDNCLEDLGSLAAAVTRNGSWTSDCTSENQEGSYAQFYSFTLGQETQVTIDLTSDEDTYLYLLRGPGRDGAEAASNDDIESGNTDSQVVATLAAGTYTIEATTYNASTTGSFTLTVTPAGGRDSSSGSTRQCMEDLGSLSEAISMTGSWTSDCTSENRDGSYALYYSFTLGQETEVTIDLTSTEDTYLYLLAGSGRDGAEVASNDDIENGNTNSRIISTLAAGTYTAEATTYDKSATGSHTMTATPAR